MLEAPRQITLGVNTYKVEEFTLAVQSAFEKYLANRALQLIKSQRGAIGELDYLALLQDHLFRIAHNGYEFWGEACLRYLAHREHLVELLWYVFTPNQPGITRETVAALYDEHHEELRELAIELGQSKKN